ncbi:kelch repeat-containing protein [soil metagenome]
MHSILKFLVAVVGATLLSACGGGGNGSSAAISALTDLWSAAAKLQHARVDHTATLLQNGKVLIVGGSDTSENAFNVTSAEVYDPATNTWTSAGAINTAGVPHTATLLQSGKVLVVHGATAELYDPSSNAWSNAGRLGEAHRGTATLLSNGKVLVAGGLAAGGYVAVAELYDPVTNAWSAAGTMLTARGEHSATRLANGKVLVAGGIGTSGSLGSAELYDPVSNSWSAGGSLVGTSGANWATLLPNGKVLVLTSSNVELYEPVTNTWTASPMHGVAPAWSTATMLSNGKVLVTGGEMLASSGNNSRSSVDLASVYDPATNLWTSTAGLPKAKHRHTATLLPSGKVLVTGGVYFYSRLINALLSIFEIFWNALDSAEIFNPLNL